MKIIELDQKSKEWIKWRLDGITASDYPILEGFENFKTIDQLLDEKVRFLYEEKAPTWPMIKGNVYEMFARDWVEYELGEKLSNPCIEHDEAPFLRCSLDGLSEKKDFIVEIKVPAKKYHEQALSGEIPAHYLPQVYFQLMVSGVDQCFYLSYYPEKDEKALVLVKKNNEIQEKIRQRASNFWMKVLVNRLNQKVVRLPSPAFLEERL